MAFLSVTGTETEYGFSLFSLNYLHTNLKEFLGS